MTRHPCSIIGTICLLVMSAASNCSGIVPLCPSGMSEFPPTAITASFDMVPPAALWFTFHVSRFTPEFLIHRPQRPLETDHGRPDQARADLAYAGLFVSDTGVDERKDVGVEHFA